MQRIMGVAVMVLATGCPPSGGYTHRGAGSDGTAKWAFGLAQPCMTSFAADASFRELIGEAVFLDGRLPDNGGSWGVIAYSPSTAQSVQCDVSFDGTVAPVTSAAAAPGPGVQVPVPSWADSSTVFAATDGQRDAKADMATLVVFNFTSYDPFAGQAIWGINFNAGANQLVHADGTYAGPE